MPCSPEILKNVSLFALLDDDEAAILAAQVEERRFAPRQRIYKMGDAGERAYVMVSGRVQVTTVDGDQQEVLVDEPGPGDFFGFASMMDETPHQTAALALEDTVCVEVDRNDILALLQQKPHSGIDMLSVLGRQFHASQQLVRLRAAKVEGIDVPDLDKALEWAARCPSTARGGIVEVRPALEQPE